MKVTFKNEAGKTVVVPTSHPAHDLIKATITNGLPVVYLASASLIVLAIGSVIALFSGQWMWLAYAIGFCIPVKRPILRRTLNIAFYAAGAYLIYRFGFGFAATFIFVIPTLLLFFTRSGAKTLKANGLKIKSVLAEHPLPSA